MRPRGLLLIQREVPAGWLVIAGADMGDSVAPLGVTFVPDPNHEWRAERRIVFDLNETPDVSGTIQ